MLINEVMSRACNKHIKSDEKSELTIIQAWDGEVVNICNNDGFFHNWLCIMTMASSSYISTLI